MTSKEIIEKLKPYYPKIGYPTMTMVNHASEYGVVLCPKALEILGLKKTKTRRPFTTKRLSVSVSASENRNIENRLSELGLTKQEYIKKLIQEDLDEYNNNP